MRTLALLAVLALSCRGPDKPVELTLEDAQASPQANAQPAPIATPVTPAIGAASPDSGPPPSPLRADRPVEADSLPVTLMIFALQATLHPADMPLATHSPEVSATTIEAIRRSADSPLLVELSPTRLRIQFNGRSFLLPENTEVRARTDSYGHVYVSRDGLSYRVLGPGTLRAHLGERRVDVSPLSSTDVVPHGEGAKRLGMKTRRVDVTTRAAKATFEIAKVEGLGEGGILLGRTLLDLISAPPATAFVGVDEVPLRAELHWTTRGATVFEVTSLVRRGEGSSATLATPPANAAFQLAPMPGEAGEQFLTPQELGAMHTGPSEIDGGAGTPNHGSLTLFNGTDAPRIVWLDGAKIAWIASDGRMSLTGLHRGHYQLETRSFLDDAAEPPRTVTVPGSVEIGNPDAGAP